MSTENNGLKILAEEVFNRYGVVPNIQIEDVIFDSGKRTYVIKRYSTAEEHGYSLCKFEPKQSCRRCYGFGYVGIFEEMDKGKKTGEFLKFCSCLKEKKDA